jgi:hypothetical protein
MRSADRVRKCLLLGVDRTYDGHHQTDATDPKRTSPNVRYPVAIRGKADIEQVALTKLDHKYTPGGGGAGHARVAACANLDTLRLSAREVRNLIGHFTL